MPQPRAHATGTKVPVERTITALKKFLERWGGGDFGYKERSTPNDAAVLVDFVFGGIAMQFIIALPLPTDPRFTEYKQGWSTRSRSKAAAQALYEAEVKRRWRVLHEVIKAKIVGVVEEVTTFEEAWLPHMVDEEGGRVMYRSDAQEWVQHHIVPLEYTADDIKGLLGPAT